MVAVYKDTADVEADLFAFRLVLAGCLVVLFGVITGLTLTSMRTIAEVELQHREIVKHREREARFFANLSHELRTPLAAIRGFAAMLVAGPTPLGRAEG